MEGQVKEMDEKSVEEKLASELVKRDISRELWREYEWVIELGENEFDIRTYLIENPVELSYRPGGTTHRIVDKDGVAHLVPKEGRFGCVIRWLNQPDSARVNF